MRLISVLRGFCFSLAALSLTSASLAVGDVVISQVWGGSSGTAGVAAHPKADYVELYNRSANPVSLSGWSLQVDVPTTTGTTWTSLVLPAVSIDPGRYFLIRVSNNSTAGIDLPTPDAVFGGTPVFTELTTSGRVALMSTTATIAVPCPAANVVDLVSYGSTSTCFEGSGRAPANSTSTTAPTAIFRGAGGCADTDDNQFDFYTATPAPRNSATPASGPCPAYGACCRSTDFETCSIMSAAECGSNYYLGDGATCSGSPCQVRTCCLPNGVCCTFAPPHCAAAWSGTPGALTSTSCTADNGTCVAVPANDLCSGATPLLVGVPTSSNAWKATSTGDGLAAPCLSGVSVSSKGVWFTFAPTATSTYEFNTCGTQFNSDLTLYTIPNCANPSGWTVVACDDNACPNSSNPFCASTGSSANVSARLSGVPLLSGQTYYLRLTLNGTINTFGNYTLVVNNLGAAATGACCYATNGRCDIRTSASCTDAEVNPVGTYQGDNTTCPSTDFCGVGPYGACCSTSGACQTRLSTGCTGGTVFWLEAVTCEPFPCTITPLPPNGSCATAINLSTPDLPYNAVVGMNQAPDGPLTGCSTANPTHNAVWYTFTPAVDSVLSAWETGGRDTSVVVYDGTFGCSGLIELQCESTEDDANYPVQAGHLYYILYTTTGSASTNVNDFYNIKIKAGVPSVPANDLCSGAIAISPSASFQTFSAGGATHEPRSSCQTLNSQPNEARNGVWFTYTTGADDVIARFLRANNAQFYSAQIFTGGCAGLTEYLCINLGTSSPQAVPLHKNTTYYFMMHKRSGYVAFDGTYSFTFNLDSPGPAQVPNQECSSAEIIALPYVASVDNTLAFDESPSLVVDCPTAASTPDPAGAAGFWYAYAPTAPTLVRVEELNSNAQTAIAVFEGFCGGPRIMCTVTGTDTSGSNNFRAYPPNTYFILIAMQSAGIPTGTAIPLSVSITGTEVPVPANDDCSTATVIPGLPFADSVAVATAHDDSPRAVCSGGSISNVTRNGIWYSYTNGPTRTAVVMSDSSSLNTLIAAYKGVCGSLIPVMCTDDPDTNNYLIMEPNTTYHILAANTVDFPTAGANTINFSMDLAPSLIEPPYNQFCTNPRIQQVLPFTQTAVPLASANGAVTACSGAGILQSTNPLWFEIDGGVTGFTLQVYETGTNDVTYAVYQTCGGLEVFCDNSDGTLATPRTFSFVGGTRYYLQVARQSNSDFALSAANYALTLTAPVGTSGACCTGTVCVATVIESCAGSFVPGQICDSANPVACCPANFNQMTGLQVGDIFDFLNAWFLGDYHADFNRSGKLEVQDIFDFLNAWFAGC